MNRKLSILPLVLLLLIGFFLAGCDAGSQNNAPPPAEVDVALPLKKKIVDLDEYTGRFQAIEEVDIRARVTGYLDAILFKDGQPVKKGDVLFIIDQRPFRYALTRAESQLILAKRQYERATQLKKESFISNEVIDQRWQEMQSAQTLLDEAKLNLEFTEIKSPISGKISRYFVSIGNLIRMNDTVLTRVVSTNPIHFYFETSQNDLLKYIRLEKSGKGLLTEQGGRSIHIKLQDEHDFVHQGTFDFMDNVVDTGTGTVLARAIVPNPDGLIYSGLFGRAQLAGSAEYEALLLPDNAINTEQTRKYVYVVDNKNRVHHVYVELGPQRDSGFYVIRKGLKGNEQVVISGLQRIRAPDQEVKPIKIPLAEGE